MREQNKQGLFENIGSLSDELNRYLLMEGIKLSINRLNSVIFQLQMHNEQGLSTFTFLYDLVNKLKRKNGIKATRGRNYEQERITHYMRTLKLTEKEAVEHIARISVTKSAANLEEKKKLEQAKRIFFKKGDKEMTFKNLKQASEWYSKNSLMYKSASGAKAYILKRLKANKELDYLGCVWWRADK